MILAVLFNFIHYAEGFILVFVVVHEVTSPLGFHPCMFFCYRYVHLYIAFSLKLPFSCFITFLSYYIRLPVLLTLRTVTDGNTLLCPQFHGIKMHGLL
jgi:hypothetical protein